MALVLALALLGLLEAARRAGRSYIQSIMAGFEPGLPLPVTKSTEKLHRDLFVVDLHCDATFVPRCDVNSSYPLSAAALGATRGGKRLFCSHTNIPSLPGAPPPRSDFLARANTSVCGIFHCERSHVDLPRMLEGNIGLQVQDRWDRPRQPPPGLLATQHSPLEALALRGQACSPPALGAAQAPPSGGGGKAPLQQLNP